MRLLWLDRLRAVFALEWPCVLRRATERGTGLETPGVSENCTFSGVENWPLSLSFARPDTPNGSRSSWYRGSACHAVTDGTALLVIGIELAGVVVAGWGVELVALVLSLNMNLLEAWGKEGNEVGFTLNGTQGVGLVWLEVKGKLLGVLKTGGVVEGNAVAVAEGSCAVWFV